MPRTADPTRPKRNPTEERLRATPFASVEELNAAEEAVKHSVWLEFERAREAHDLLTKPRYAFLLEELKAGLTALTGKRGKERIYRIYSEGVGLQVEINQDFTSALGEGESRFLEGVLRAGIEGYGRVYMQTKRLIPSADIEPPKRADGKKD